MRLINASEAQRKPLTIKSNTDTIRLKKRHFRVKYALIHRQ
jgi:hypothetical protein